MKASQQKNPQESFWVGADIYNLNIFSLFASENEPPALDGW